MAVDPMGGTPTTPSVVPVPPTATPAVVPPVVPVPPILGGAGVTTSEWKLVIGYVAQAAAVGTAAVIAKFGFHVSDADLQLIVNLEFAVAIPVVGYALSRGLAKVGL